MVKTKGKAALAAAGYKYITALTTPQVRKLLRAGVLRLEWFTPHVHEVVHGPIRLVLRRSEAVRRKEQRRRHDKLAKLHEVDHDTECLCAHRDAGAARSRAADPVRVGQTI